MVLHEGEVGCYTVTLYVTYPVILLLACDVSLGHCGLDGRLMWYFLGADEDMELHEGGAGLLMCYP
jgi:hypothetical protein